MDRLVDATRKIVVAAIHRAHHVGDLFNQLCFKAVAMGAKGYLMSLKSEVANNV